ncbi:hypothetical protein SCALM49S_03080 [Streptomyces californicus]
MMNAPVGSSPYVTGSSSATAIAGPIPGSTPIAVPRRTPMAAQSRFIGVSAVPKPSMRELRESIGQSTPISGPPGRGTPSRLSKTK